MDILGISLLFVLISYFLFSGRLTHKIGVRWFLYLFLLGFAFFFAERTFSLAKVLFWIMAFGVHGVLLHYSCRLEKAYLLQKNQIQEAALQLAPETLPKPTPNKN